MHNVNAFSEKIKESCEGVLPIIIIVGAVCLFFVPIDSGLVLSFVIGGLLLIAGMALFQIGSDTAMTQIGNHTGAKLTQTRNLLLITVLALLLGAAITVAEPDLQVLAENVPSINTRLLIWTVSAGVGVFLAMAMLRIVFAVPIKYMLVGSYILVFVLAFLSDRDFLSVAFDSGGVTTGPMTVPFIMSLGAGVAHIRSDSNAKADGFGLVGLCSIGPILAVLILGFIYPGDAASASSAAADYSTSLLVGHAYLKNIPVYMLDVATALLPIFIFFMIFQVVSLKLKKKPFLSILIGLAYTYSGLVLFLTGANVGFGQLGYVLGEELYKSAPAQVIIMLAVLMGWFIINAEPAVHVLNRQVEEMSAGTISAKSMGIALSVGVAAANGISAARALYGIDIMYFIIPGYVISLALSFFVPQTFTAIAFDSGGVASGPMTAGFMLPFVMGICSASGGNLMTDAFGLVSMVAMMPLITVQVMGALSSIAAKKSKAELRRVAAAQSGVIELWEV